MLTYSRSIQKNILLCFLWISTQTTWCVASAYAEKNAEPSGKPAAIAAISASVPDTAELEKQFQHARALANGTDVPRDDAAALSLYQKLAGQGYFKAQHNLGVMYFNGAGVAKNPAEAIKWFRKAAEQGTLLSQECLADVLARGDGVPRDIKEALHWFQKAAEQGSVSSQERLGEIYFDGTDGVAQDYALALKYFQQAADAGNLDAQTNIGCMYEFGLGVTRDKSKAASFYKNPAEQGHAKAQADLGMLLGDAPKNPDLVEAYKWLTLSANQGQATAEKALVELRMKISAPEVEEAERRIAEFKKKR